MAASLPPRLVDRLSSDERKEYPIATGVLDYFPDALALIAHLSWAGNEKHNPGEELHWARGKSTDQVDCIARHLISRDGSDFIKIPDGREIEIPHRVATAWRALAELQIWAEQTFKLGLPKGARNPGPAVTKSPRLNALDMPIDERAKEDPRTWTAK